MKKFLPIVFAASILLAACGTDKTADTTVSDVSDAQANVETTETETTTDTEVVPGTEDEGAAETEHEMVTEGATEVSQEYTFEDLSKYSFEFGSGAGGWSTDFNIEKDGSFKGNYHDSDMGTIGEGYENGTIYVATFEGHFTELCKVDEYTYEMKLADITYGEEDGTEEIVDGIRYCYTNNAYGLTGTDRFLVYAPGTPVSVLNEEVYSWVQWSVGDGPTLDKPIIVNEDQQEGIYSYERLSPAEEAQTIYSSSLESYEQYTKEIAAADTQGDMNELSNAQYKVADDCLNQLWDIIKNNTDEATFEPILEEQRQWIKKKEEKAQAAADECEGGSLGTFLYSDTLASMTMDRCKELLDIISDITE